MNNSVIITQIPSYQSKDIFNFAMNNLFCFCMMFEPKEIFDYFSYFNMNVNFNCLLGRCGDLLLIVCY